MTTLVSDLSISTVVNEVILEEAPLPELIERAARRGALAAVMQLPALYLVIDAGAGPDARFIEIETEEGVSVNAGEWEKHGAYYRLRIPTLSLAGVAHAMLLKLQQLENYQAALIERADDEITRHARAIAEGRLLQVKQDLQLIRRMDKIEDNNAK